MNIEYLSCEVSGSVNKVVRPLGGYIILNLH